MEDIYYDPSLRVLICKTHGIGIRPTLQAITRHLRGQGHHQRGRHLKDSVSDALRRPLATTSKILLASEHDPGRPPQPALPYLKIFSGFRCRNPGCGFLTTSAELRQRHSAKCPMRTTSSSNSWERCKLQTIFLETGYRRYFVVPDSTATAEHGKDNELGAEDSCLPPFTSSTFAEQHQALLDSTEGVPRDLRSIHPMAQLASQHLRFLPIRSLDEIFRSEAFPLASDPLFDPNHIDARRSMLSLFPGCESDAAFMHALVFAMLQFIPGDSEKQRQLRVLAKRGYVENLNEKFSSSAASRSPSLIGAVALLKVAAYKDENEKCHDIHANGLNTLLHSFDTALVTADMKRALFRQDLYSTIFTKSSPSLANVHSAEEVTFHEVDREPPPGFTQNGLDLPYQLLRCVLNISELQQVHEHLLSSDYESRYTLLDSMQASIESRLIGLKDICLQRGAHVEAVRLGVFICCHCSWTEVWRDTFIAGKLATSLLELLESSLIGPQAGMVWTGRLSVLLWLVLVASSVIERKHGAESRDLTRLRRRVTYLTLAALEDSPAGQATTAIESATRDYLYCDGWLESRNKIKEWKDIEDAVKNKVDD